MTNDTTTLSGALLEMKDQLIYELGQKGVTASYDPSTGLLGLISKIGDIQTGGGGGSNSLTLTSDKSILDYSTSDTATLTATVLDVNNQAMSGVTVEFFKGATSLGTSLTDNNGVATKTYSSTGSGDMSFTCQAINLTSNSVSIEDCKYYNATETTLNRGSYQVGTTIASNVAGSSDNWVVEFDCKGTNNGGCLNVGASTGYTPNSNTANYRFGLGFDVSSSSFRIYANSRSTTSSSNVSNSATRDTYYHFKIVKNGTSISFYYNDNLIVTKTASWVSNYSQYDIYPCVWSGSTSSITWKNLKFKTVGA